MGERKESREEDKDLTYTNVRAKISKIGRAAANFESADLEIVVEWGCDGQEVQTGGMGFKGPHNVYDSFGESHGGACSRGNSGWWPVGGGGKALLGS